MSDLAERIRIAAERVESLNWLATAIDVPRRTLGNWLTGTNPKPDALRRIAQVTGVSLDWLLTGDGDPDESALSAGLRKLTRADVHGVYETPEDVVAGGQEKDRLIERSYRGHDIEVIEHLEPEPQAVTISPAVFREVKKLVDKINKAAGIRLPEDARDYEVIRWYNELAAMARGNLDEQKLRLLLPALEYEIIEAVRSAVAEPGTGKHSAS